MSFFRQLNPRNNRFACALVLAATVLLTGLQALEAGHTHTADDVVEQCLLCKSSADQQVTTQPATVATFLREQTVTDADTLVTQTSHYRSHQPRGPPLYS